MCLTQLLGVNICVHNNLVWTTVHNILDTLALIGQQLAIWAQAFPLQVSSNVSNQ
jgi:hypothetical protein